MALAKHKHFKKAAEACSVTQPTLSMQLQKLEDQIGLVLFNRKVAPIMPTREGYLFIKQAEKILNEIDRLGQVIESQKDVIKGSFNLGALPTIAPYLFPRMLKDLTEQLPNVSFSAFEKTTDQLVESVLNNEIDIGLMVTPYSNDQLKFHSLYKEEFYLYVSHRHKLFEKQEVDADDLNPEEIWVLEEGHCFRDQVLNICGRKNGQAGQFAYRSGSLEALKRLVDKYGGITLLPELALEDFDKNSMLHIRKITPPTPVREVSLVVKENFASLSLVETIKKIIKSSLPFNLQEKNDITIIKY